MPYVEFANNVLRVVHGGMLVAATYVAISMYVYKGEVDTGIMVGTTLLWLSTMFQCLLFRKLQKLD